MAHINNVQKVATISFENVDFETSIEVAKEMREEIISFLKENPDRKIELDFGGYARLSLKFAKELCKGKDFKNNLERISTKEMHLFDGTIIAQALE